MVHFNSLMVIKKDTKWCYHPCTRLDWPPCWKSTRWCHHPLTVCHADWKSMNLPLLNHVYSASCQPNEGSVDGTESDEFSSSYSNLSSPLKEIKKPLPLFTAVPFAPTKHPPAHHHPALVRVCGGVQLHIISCSHWGVPLRRRRRMRPPIEYSTVRSVGAAISSA